VHERQLSTLAGVSGLLVDAGLDWWLFGGWRSASTSAP
jgi:hypothetical protein